MVVLLSNVSFADTLPDCTGLKTTLKLTVVPTVSVKGSVNPLTLNPVPVRLWPVTVNVAEPVFLICKGIVCACPTDTFPKLMMLGDVVNRPCACANGALVIKSNVMFSTARKGRIHRVKFLLLANSMNAGLVQGNLMTCPVSLPVLTRNN